MTARSTSVLLASTLLHIYIVMWSCENYHVTILFQGNDREHGIGCCHYFRITAFTVSTKLLRCSGTEMVIYESEEGEVYAYWRRKRSTYHYAATTAAVIIISRVDVSKTDGRCPGLITRFYNSLNLITHSLSLFGRFARGIVVWKRCMHIPGCV